MANRPANAGSDSAGPNRAVVHVLAWLPYLAVLACAATGLFITFQGSRYAAQGTALAGVALLLAAVARLLLPARYAGPLVSRHKAPDVAGFAVFGTAVLVLALMLP
jgi:Protein of unknown function (DUF3017)